MPSVSTPNTTAALHLQPPRLPPIPPHTVWAILDKLSGVSMTVPERTGVFDGARVETPGLDIRCIFMCSEGGKIGVVMSVTDKIDSLRPGAAPQWYDPSAIRDRLLLVLHDGTALRGNVNTARTAGIVTSSLSFPSFQGPQTFRFAMNRIGEDRPLAIEANPAPCALIGAPSLDGRIRLILDRYFKRVDISQSGCIEWELKDDALAEEAVEAMSVVNSNIHGKSLWPGMCSVDEVPGYNTRSGPRSGHAVLGVPGSQRNGHDKMQEFLSEQGLVLSTRYNSIVSLNLFLLLTGGHPLADGGQDWREQRLELRDARGILSAAVGQLVGFDHPGDAESKSERILALGSRA